MRIRRIQIERFGAWHDQEIPLAENGLNVLYGPNEAGKSTIMRLVRRLLFGFRADDESAPGPRPRRVACAGRLTFTGARGEYELRRESEFGTRGRVMLTHGADGPLAPDVLQELLCGVSEEEYAHLFAVGLEELQQLATLQGADAARRIFDLTLGPDGDRIVAACRLSESFRRRFWDDTRDAGELRSLAERVEAADRELAARGDPMTEYRRMQADSRRVEAEVLDQKQRLRGLQEQLRGHLFLERVWAPWRRQQELQRKHAALDVRADFPEDGVDQLDRLSGEIARHRRQRRAVRRAAREAAREVSGLATDVRLIEHAFEVRRLLERSPALAALQVNLAGLRTEAETLRGHSTERRQRLGSEWTDQRVSAVDVSPAAASKLCTVAQTYRLALVQRSRHLRRYQRLAALVQQDQAGHAERLRGCGGRDFDEMYDELTDRAAALRDVGQALPRVSAAESTASMLRAQRESVANRRQLPPYYYGVLGLFGAGGAVLVLLGLFDVVHSIRGGPAPWLVGAVFLLLGTCCAAVTWTMKRQFDPADGLLQEIDARLAMLDDEVSTARTQLESVHEQIPTEVSMETRGSAGDQPPLSTDRVNELQRELHRRLEDLKDLEQTDHALREQRQRLSRMRGRLREHQRRVSEARRAWCSLLKEIGLDESVRIRPSIETWQLIAELRDLQRLRMQVDESISQNELQVREFDAEIAHLSEEIDGTAVSHCQPVEQLKNWQQRLQAGAAARERRRVLRAAVRTHRRDMRRHTDCIHRLDAARLKLLVSVGATSPEEFRELYRRCLQSRELDQQLEQVGLELAAAARTEPELAIVEDDLVRFDAEQNQHAIHTIRAELDDLERDLQTSHESLGRLRHEMQLQESDRTVVRLRRERAVAGAELDHAVHRFCAGELAARALDMLRDRIERNSQPETLIRAAGFLQNLTAGKYTRVWTPAGERRLIIEDDERHSLRVEQLSSGTREQLFLAIRLALLEQYRERGVDLPVIFDDIIANFDQLRTEAAVETLVDFAARGGQVLLFTCHLYLARLFEDAGVTPARLPEPRPVLERRRVG